MNFSVTTNGLPARTYVCFSFYLKKSNRDSWCCTVNSNTETRFSFNLDKIFLPIKIRLIRSLICDEFQQFFENVNRWSTSAIVWLSCDKNWIVIFSVALFNFYFWLFDNRLISVDIRWFHRVRVVRPASWTWGWMPEELRQPQSIHGAIRGEFLFSITVVPKVFGASSPPTIWNAIHPPQVEICLLFGIRSLWMNGVQPRTWTLWPCFLSQNFSKFFQLHLVLTLFRRSHYHLFPESFPFTPSWWICHKL